MNTKDAFNNVKDPIVRAEALRAKAIADTIIAGVDGLRNLVAAVKARIAAFIEYRRTFDVLTGMTNRELDDIGISRGDIPAVARGVDPRPQAAGRVPTDALARRLALAEAFEQESAAGEKVGDEAAAAVRANDNRSAVAA